jgi:hypothetical protein
MQTLSAALFAGFAHGTYHDTSSLFSVYTNFSPGKLNFKVLTDSTQNTKHCGTASRRPESGPMHPPLGVIRFLECMGIKMKLLQRMRAHASLQ